MVRGRYFHFSSNQKQTVKYSLEFSPSNIEQFDVGEALFDIDNINTNNILCHLQICYSFLLVIPILKLHQNIHV